MDRVLLYLCSMLDETKVKDFLTRVTWFDITPKAMFKSRKLIS